MERWTLLGGGQHGEELIAAVASGEVVPAEPASVAAFLASEAERGFRAVTISRRAAAIAAAHRAQDQPNPCDSRGGRRR